MKTERTILIAILITAVAGSLLGQALTSDSACEWRMHGTNVAGTGGSGGSSSISGSTGHAVHGATYLYNTRTGKVYRIYGGCSGDDGKYGCIVSVPMFSADRLSDYLPNPATDDSPGFDR